VKFADQVILARRAKGMPEVDLTEIHVFRGLPSRRHEPGQHARVQRQASNWTRDRRVSMYLRPLRYPRDWPENRSQEKGVDVALAIEIVRAAITGSADLVIVATRDTDVVPALELVQNDSDSTVELANWHGQSELKLSPQPDAVRLDKSAFQRSRDTYNYA
jgi:uncharacterized LabA/DUF88 family protein